MSLLSTMNNVKVSPCGLQIAYLLVSDPTVLWIAQETTDGFSDPIPLCHSLNITAFTWATNDIISVSEDGFLRRWHVTEAFFLYECYIGIEVDAKSVLYENHSLTLVGEDTISRYTESEYGIKGNKEISRIPGLTTVVLHGCGTELTYAAGSFLIWSAFGLYHSHQRRMEGTIFLISSSSDSGFLLVSRTQWLTVLDGASRCSLYDIPLPGITGAFYTFGDRYIVTTSSVGVITAWEAASPEKHNPVVRCHREGDSLPFASPVDSTVSVIRFEDEFPRRHVILRDQELGCSVQGYRLQIYPCRAVVDAPICVECQENRTCMFMGVRFLPKGDDNIPLLQNDGGYPVIYNRVEVKPNLIDWVQVSVAPFIKDFLTQELDHIVSSSKDNLVRLQMDHRYSHTCDGCGIATLWCLSICMACGKNLCHACKNTNQLSLAACQTGSDQPHIFVRGTFFSETDLKAEKLKLEQVLKRGSLVLPDIFNTNIWCGEPTVTVCDIKGLFTPLFFIERYENVACVVVSQNGKESSTTVGQYFRGYGNSGQSAKILKDWPPATSMDDDLAAMFFSCLPFPEFMTPTGALNLASSYPRNGALEPDLGPKMYAGMRGSCTKLHIDHSDAINLMFHGEATWHIFDQRDADNVELYLKSLDDHPPENFNTSSDLLKLFSVDHYLTTVDLANLRSRFNVEPTVIQQLPGEAIIIPAGCPHQVRNTMDSIKLAVDFISPLSTEAILDMATKLSNTNRGRDIVRTDLVAFRCLLYHVWMRCSRMDKPFHPFLTSYKASFVERG